MQDLSLHILDIVENAIRAGGKKIVIETLEDTSRDQLTVRIQDDGRGMDKETAKKAMDPFFTTKDGRKVGLGLGLLSQAAEQTGGYLTIESEQGAGTKVTAVFNQSHPDMKPMGDILATFAALITGNPSVRFIYDCKMGDYNFRFDSFKSREE
jgi:signal transduction histidine kinase